MVKDFKLKLDPPQQEYTPGSVVSGTLSFRLKEAKSHYKSIHVGLYGKSHVRWTETYQDDEGNPQERVYESSETYVKEVKTFWKPEDSSDGSIGPDTYKYEFELTLPANCPSSFVGSDGNIRYYIEGGIAKNGDKNHFDDIPINVRLPIDVNESSLVKPVRKVERKQVGFWCCAAGDIELSVEVPRTGFLVGEDSIPLTVNVKNGSSRDLSIRAKIIKKHFFYAQEGGSGLSSSRGSPVDLVVENSEAIEPNSTVAVELPALKVPSTELTIFHSSNIKLFYELLVQADISWSLDLYIRIPIVIGDTKSEA